MLRVLVLGSVSAVNVLSFRFSIYCVEFSFEALQDYSFSLLVLEMLIRMQLKLCKLTSE